MSKRNRGRSGASRAQKAQRLKDARVKSIRNGALNAKKGADFVKGAGNFVKGAAGQTVKAVGGAIKGTAVGAAKVLGPFVAGAAIGTAYKNTDRAPAVSGRGAGRATFQDSNNDNRPNAQKPDVPAQLAVDSNGSNGARGENRSGVEPINGSFRTAVKQGPDGGATPSSGNAGSGNGGTPVKPTPGSRTNANGLQQYGQTLGGLNEFTAAFTGGYQLTDIKTAFQSNDLEGAYQTGSNTIADTGDKYELPDAQVPLTGGNSYEGAKGVSSEETSYEIPEASVPGTVGRGNTEQDGTSDKPDVADQVRQVRMRRKGPRDEGSFRGFNIDRNNAIASQPKEEAPDPEKIAQQQRRNKIRSTFMDLDTPIIKASVAANAVAGYGKNSDGEAMFNYGGKLVRAKDGMQQQAKNAVNMGRNPAEFLDIKIKEVQEKEKDKK